MEASLDHVFLSPVLNIIAERVTGFPRSGRELSESKAAVIRTAETHTRKKKISPSFHLELWSFG